jgi:hypothetical protein
MNEKKIRTPLTWLFFISTVLLGLSLACTAGDNSTNNNQGDNETASTITQQALDLQATEKSLSDTQEARENAPTNTPVPPQPTATFTPIPPPSATPTEVDDTATLIVDNKSSIKICSLYIVPSTNNDWGNNQLDSDEISPKSTYDLWGIPPGSYNMRVDNCSGQELAVQKNIIFDPYDEITWTLEDETPPASDKPANTQPPAPAVLTCQDQTGGRTKVRVENRTGNTATLYLYGPENYSCSIPGGVHKIYVKAGNYSISSYMCGGQSFNWGSHVVNSGWYFTLTCP